jgi:hypothetical protein
MIYTAISGNGNMAGGTDNGIYFKIGNTSTSVVVPQQGEGGIDVTGIDNFGDVVFFFNGGESCSFGVGQCSFFRDATGNCQTIYVPGSVYTEALGMNNLSEVPTVSIFMDFYGRAEGLHDGRRSGS